MRRRGCFIPFLWLGAVAVLVACGGAAPPKDQKATENPLVVPFPQERYADDLARFLAGLPGRPGTPFAKFETTPAWQMHRRDMDSAWAELERQRLPAMRGFQQGELGGPTATATVFYPFSGPDVLTIALFFPHSPLYVMVGLEPAGTLPSARELETKDLGDYLAETRLGLDSEMVRSFFITRQMDHEFRGQITDGLCLPILELLVRSGYTVLSFRYIRLDEHGQVVERAAGYHAPGRIGDKGVEIQFRSDADGSSHRLLYLSVNLDNSHLQLNPQFLTFVSGLKGATTFLKATSYMVHHPEFSIIREHVLTESTAVLQDDSGVPYHYYESPQWRVQLYGQYVQPYGSFRYLLQPDLRQAYLTQQPKPLPFRISYGFRAVPSNLLYATKLK